ncbi:hypothetical protein APA_1476 [Pseudanabaena sp. lw0831]|uniref:hypothetical protein n=1 Tax=Pseudanabaena sp. lw0831 TaxID=1357935 RepID=UPI00191572C2|nr:hypothetical protein [Pseudanabaena sp. lw0831]GBO53569.1 hypothetical protein APA_1476 [Pseudanabaena sp. lw0831]
MSDNYQVKPVDKLFRWVHPGQFHPTEMRPTSAIFRGEYMSVDIAQLTNLEASYERAKKLQKNAVVSFTAELAFDLQQRVTHCPTQLCESTNETVCFVDTGCSAYQINNNACVLICTNDAHGCVIGDKTKAVSKAFAKNCGVEIFPSEAS